MCEDVSYGVGACGGCRVGQVLGYVYKLAGSRLQVHFLFENGPLIDFQIGNERNGRQIGGRGCNSYLKMDH